MSGDRRGRRGCYREHCSDLRQDVQAEGHVPAQWGLQDGVRVRPTLVHTQKHLHIAHSKI